MKRKRGGRKADHRISLAPLTFEEALKAILQTGPPEQEKAQEAEGRPPPEDEASERPAS